MGWDRLSQSVWLSDRWCSTYLNKIYIHKNTYTNSIKYIFFTSYNFISYVLCWWKKLILTNCRPHLFFETPCKSSPNLSAAMSALLSVWAVKTGSLQTYWGWKAKVHSPPGQCLTATYIATCPCLLIFQMGGCRQLDLDAGRLRKMLQLTW